MELLHWSRGLAYAQRGAESGGNPINNKLEKPFNCEIRRQWWRLVMMMMLIQEWYCLLYFMD